MAYYPTTLPGPTKAAHNPKPRISSPRLPGAADYLARERDYSGTMDVEFFLDSTQAAAFYAWWKTDLAQGGLWFNANWPAMRPGFLTLQFLSEPTFTHAYNGAHRVSATVQVRGESLEVVNLVDPLYDSTILIYNMRETPGTAPPVDSSPYRKVFAVFGASPIYGVDSSDGPFTGSGSNNHILSGGTIPSRSASTDPAWNFDSGTQTITLEGWVKVTPVDGNARVNTLRFIDNAGLGNWIWPWFFRTSGAVRAGFDVIGSTLVDTLAGVASNVWFHYVLQHTGDRAYLGVAGVRLGSAVVGLNTFNSMMLQFGGTSLGTFDGSGSFIGPHRVTVADRYSLHLNAGYLPPSTKFPVKSA